MPLGRTSTSGQRSSYAQRYTTHMPSFSQRVRARNKTPEVVLAECVASMVRPMARDGLSLIEQNSLGLRFESMWRGLILPRHRVSVSLARDGDDTIVIAAGKAPRHVVRAFQTMHFE